MDSVSIQTIGQAPVKNQQSTTSISSNIAFEWKLLKTKNTATNRGGHSMCVSSSDTAIIFGGANQIGQMNDIWSLKANKFSKLKSKGDVHPPCTGIQGQVVENKFYVFGGFVLEDQMMPFSNQLSVYDMKSHKWETLEPTGSVPSARDKYVSVSIGTDIYYFGGFGPAEVIKFESDDNEDSSTESTKQDQEDEDEPPSVEFKWYNDLYKYDTKTNNFELIVPIGATAPSPRAAAAGALSSSKEGYHLFIFGGRDPVDRKNDLWRFDFATLKWSQYNAKGVPPSGRSFTSLISYDNKWLIVAFGVDNANDNQGDISLFHLPTESWINPKSIIGHPKLPMPCQMIGGVVLEKKAVYFGGFSSTIVNQDGEEFFNDIYSDTTWVVDLTPLDGYT